MANGVVDTLFNRLPPAARHAVILIVMGFALGTTYVTFDIRLSAAETKAEEAKAAAALTDKKIEDVSRKVDKVDTAQQVLQQTVQGIKDTQAQTEARSTRIENKLDDLTRALTRGVGNGR